SYACRTLHRQFCFLGVTLLSWTCLTAITPQCLWEGSPHDRHPDPIATTFPSTNLRPRHRHTLTVLRLAFRTCGTNGNTFCRTRFDSRNPGNNGNNGNTSRLFTGITRASAA
ncbi:MAG TPA: hypothetical protein VGS80_00465, partial [Ktedonobacterales bacterium]|nr:hypothetical protein [Ktedonobacterales bacterium]